MTVDFLQKYEALKRSIPIPAIKVTNNENCQFVDYTHNSKNCYYCFMGFGIENGTYCRDSGYSHDLFDCELTLFSEICYQCDRAMNCYNSIYLRDCHNCRDCHFCVECINCESCFGCVSLTHKKYCIFNKQYTKEKYEEKLKELKENPEEENLKKLYLLVKKTPYPASHQKDNISCPYGDFINNCKNLYWGFDAFYAEDCGYLFKGGIAKNCWDMTIGGGSSGVGKQKPEDMTPSELCYEMVGASGYHCAFLEQCGNCTNCYYCAHLQNCSDCFGCVGLKNKKYCVLNNQLTKKEYKEAVKIIRKELGWRE